MLTLADDVLLLACDDESGGWAAVDSLDLRLAGALLAQLAAEGRIAISDTASDDVTTDGKRIKPGRVVVRNPAPTGSPELDTALAVIAQKPRTPSHLLDPLAKGLRGRLLEGLAARGILRREERKVLGLFPISRWPAEDATHETALRRRLQAVLLDGLTPEPADAVLLAVLKGSGLEKGLVPKDRRKDARRRLDEVAQLDWADKAIRDAIAAAAAISAAVVVSVAATSSSSSSTC